MFISIEQLISKMLIYFLEINKFPPCEKMHIPWGKSTVSIYRINKHFLQFSKTERQTVNCYGNIHAVICYDVFYWPAAVLIQAI